MLVSPACRLGNNGHLDIIRHDRITVDQRLRRQNSIIEEEAMHTIRKKQPVLGIPAQVLMRFSRRGKAILQCVFMERRTIQIVAHGVLVVPAVKLETGTVDCSVTTGPPVLPGPVPVSTPEVNNKVIDVDGKSVGWG